MSLDHVLGFEVAKIRWERAHGAETEIRKRTGRPVVAYVCELMPGLQIILVKGPRPTTGPEIVGCIDVAGMREQIAHDVAEGLWKAAIAGLPTQGSA